MPHVVSDIALSRFYLLFNTNLIIWCLDVNTFSATEYIVCVAGCQWLEGRLVHLEYKRLLYMLLHCMSIDCGDLCPLTVLTSTRWRHLQLVSAVSRFSMLAKTLLLVFRRDLKDLEEAGVFVERRIFFIPSFNQGVFDLTRPEYSN